MVKNRCLTLLVAVALLGFVSTTSGDEPPHGPAHNADEAAIRASSAEYELAFNARDAKALAATFAVDAEMTDVTGRLHKGRADIESEFESIFQAQPHAKLKLKIDSIKFLSPDVAIETGTAQAAADNHPTLSPTRYAAVLIKHNGKWLLSNVNESPYNAAANPTEHLAPLAFLVGEWQAELGDGKTYRLRCEWLPGQTFLKRSFNVRQNDVDLSSGVQIIGYDPVMASVVSWTFDSNGGFGHEIWEDHGGRWRISASSVLPDGSTALAINQLNKVDDHSFTWRSLERSMNDQLLPDTALVRVIRISE